MTIHFKSYVISDDRTFINLASDDATYQTWWFRQKSGAGDRDWFFGAAALRRADSTQAMLNTVHNIVIAYDGVDIVNTRFWVNEESVSLVSKTIVNNGQTDTSLGGDVDSGNGRNRIEFVNVFRGLYADEAQARSLQSDPYQFLKPAV